jgi:uncharacterized NAD(P)/FAD-binding protein YdhS
MSSDPASGCCHDHPNDGCRDATSDGCDHPSGDRGRPVLAVIGAGAAGTLTALHLLRALGQGRARADVVLIDPAPEAGRGVAYANADANHLLNVPAGSMSALPHEPGHLVDWARRHAGVDWPRRHAGADWPRRHAGADLVTDITAADFLPRHAYGAYLADTLEAEVAHSASARLLRRAARVVALEPAGSRDLLHLSDGSRLLADSVVLAPGVFAPGTAWAPPTLLTSERFVADPWAPGALEALAQADGDVLLVGTGLTMVDVALTVQRPGRTVYAVSRRGKLPRVHAAGQQPPVPPADLPDDIDLDIATLRPAVEEHLRATIRSHGDWRPALDGMRPHTARLWSMLCDNCRADFLSKDALRWDVHRHRMPRRTAAVVGRLRATGGLQVSAGTVTTVDDEGTALVVHLSDGTIRRVAHVVNCTGPLSDVSLAGDPLLTRLLADGRAVPGPLRMGLATDRDGRVRAADHSVGSLWTLGAMRRGELWESTAVPEIRAQAIGIAGHLAAEVAAARPASPRRTPRDLMGLPLSTSGSAAQAYNTGLGRVLRVQAGADEAFREAISLDPDA